METRAVSADRSPIRLRSNLFRAVQRVGHGCGAVEREVAEHQARRGRLRLLSAVAVVLGEFTIASLLNRQVFQTALVVAQKIDPYASAIFTLLSLLFVFLLLLLVGRAASSSSRGRRRAGKASS